MDDVYVRLKECFDELDRRLGDRKCSDLSYEEINELLRRGHVTTGRLIVLSFNVKSSDLRRKVYKKIGQIIEKIGRNAEDYKILDRRMRQHVYLLPKSSEELFKKLLKKERYVEKIVVKFTDKGIVRKKVVEKVW